MSLPPLRAQRAGAEQPRRQQLPVPLVPAGPLLLLLPLALRVGLASSGISHRYCRCTGIGNAGCPSQRRPAAERLGAGPIATC